VLGHRAEYVTFAWMVWEVTRDPLHLGYLGLAQGIPLVLFQLWGGVLADRVNRLRLLLATQVLTTASLLVAFGLSALSLIRVEHLLALAALSNTFRAFDEPTRMSMVPQMVGRERLPNAVALGSIPWQAGRMIGPSITGILIAAFGGTVGLALAAVASGMALVMYSRLRVATRTPAPGGHMGAQLVEGLSFVRHNFVFAALICLALFNAVFGLSYVTLLPIFADVYSVGFSNTFYLTQVSTHLQQAVPDHLRGRVMSLYALCWNLLPLGGLLGGVLAAAVDARFAVLFGGAMVAANALALVASRRLRLL
jgi:MFS family permease